MNTQRTGVAAYTTLFNEWAADAVALEKEARKRGLAAKFHSAVCGIVQEIGFDDPAKVVSRFLNEVNRLSTEWAAEVEKEWGTGVTLAQAVPALSQYKSDYKRAIEAGMNPLDYTSAEVMKRALIELRKKGKAAETGGGGSGAGPTSGKDSDAGAGGGTNVVPLSALPAGELPPAVREAFRKLYESAKALPEAEAIDVLEKAAGICRSKLARLKRGATKAVAG